MGLRPNERQAARSFWRRHSTGWEESNLTQAEYCNRHGLALKNFINWRAQLKREAMAGSRARWGVYPPLRAKREAGTDGEDRQPQPSAQEPRVPRIEIELAGGRRVYFDHDVAPSTIEQVILTLERLALPGGPSPHETRHST